MIADNEETGKALLDKGQLRCKLHVLLHLEHILVMFWLVASNLFFSTILGIIG